MAYLAAFHWGWLAGGLLLGLGMGWISVVHRGRPLSPKMLGAVAAVVAIAVAVAAARLLPGRFGYWCDLGLALFAAYLIGCTVGTVLRQWVVARHAAARSPAR
ncbi:MAG: hypothetical protein P4M07_15875 [Xanthobacteraceae bacterium]|nr:hypothetical protein [Xanthobacteraceae bacterium]